MKNVYYVYIYLDPRIKSSFKYDDLEFGYEPFYVGKGTGLRMYSHLCDKHRSFKTNKIKSITKSKLDPIILKYKENLTEEEAYNLEIELIKKIGRSNLNEGPLTNLTPGGDGGSVKGKKKRPRTKEEIDHLRKFTLGRKHSDETRKIMREKRQAEDPEITARRAQSMKKPINKLSLTGEIIESFSSVKEVIEKFSANCKKIKEACLENKVYKNFKWSYASANGISNYKTFKDVFK